jgi:hypothetical protein
MSIRCIDNVYMSHTKHCGHLGSDLYKSSPFCFVSDFVVLTAGKRSYTRRTHSLTVVRRAVTRIVDSCDELGTWITKNIHTSHRNKRQVVTHHRHRKIITAMSVLAMRASAHTERLTRFDTNSDVIGIDNRCSGCISHVQDDFMDTLHPTTRVIRGFGGSRTMTVSIGTLHWSWDDDKQWSIPHVHDP